MSKVQQAVLPNQMNIADKQKSLKEVMNKINKKYGEGTIGTAKEFKEAGKLDKPVIPTPSLEINDALHCGGFCGIVELFGSNSSGKTSLAIETIAYNQARDPNFLAAWIETEGSITEEILVGHNVDLERLNYLRQEDVGNAENAGDIMRAILAEGSTNLLVINSVAGFAPKKDMEDDLVKGNISLTAKFMAKLLRTGNVDASRNKVTVLFINQIRDKIGEMFGDTSITTGGKALGFFASQRLKMSQVKVKAEDPITEEEGVKINFYVKKNRFNGMAPAATKGTYYAYFDKGIDSIIPLPQLLLDKGIVRQAGAYWYYENENGEVITIDGIEGKFKSRKAFLDVLRENDTWRNEMLSKITVSKRQTAEEIEETERENRELEEVGKTIENELYRDEINEDINAFLNSNDEP